MDEDEGLGAVGGGAGSTLNDPVILMEEILEMLKLLDYESKFCKTKGFKPLSKVYFAQ
jgi:hypothetical protein